MEGKLCVVTGATDGIGRVTARALAERGAEVVLVGRNAAKGAEVCKAIHSSSRNSRVRFEQADLSRQVRDQGLGRAPQRRRHGHRRADQQCGRHVHPPPRECIDGIEMTFALNHLGYFPC